MPGSFTTTSTESRDPTASQLSTLSSKPRIPLRVTGYFSILSLALFLLAGFNRGIQSTVVPPTATPTDSLSAFPSTSDQQNVQYNASLLREDLPTYLDFLGSEVLPVMSNNIDEILHNLRGLTDIRPGLFYHGHIDYSIQISGGIDGLMDMHNVVLQYHTLENPIIFIPYWREELRNIHDQNIDAWLERVNEYNRAMSTPSAASEVQFTPLTKDEASNIASSWDDYLRQNGLASPGLERLIDKVYLVDGGKQPLYQEAFQNIYRFHNIAFHSEGYLQLDNRSHLENTFSPFQINFEYIGKCQELLPVFEEASSVQFSYILNLDNIYVTQHPELSQDPEMAKLSTRLNDAISTLPDDNLIKISSMPEDRQIAYFVVGNYVFVVHGSLDSPSLFK